MHLPDASHTSDRKKQPHASPSGLPSGKTLILLAPQRLRHVGEGQGRLLRAASAPARGRKDRTGRSDRDRRGVGRRATLA